MAEGGEEMDLVADLLSKPFSRRTFQEKLDIVKKSRASPKLTSLSQPCPHRWSQICGAAKAINAGQSELHVTLLILQDPKEHVGVGKH